MQNTGLTAFRGRILDFIADPAQTTRPEDSYRYFADGLLVLQHQHVLEMGEAKNLLEKYPGIAVTSYGGEHLIVPGFVDCHIHYPQLEIIASYGTELLDWLNRYTFPAEAAFADPAHSQKIAQVFLAELLRNGTTTALVMATSHPCSVDSLFTAAEQLDMRLISGLMMMDRNAPPALLMPPQQAQVESANLISRWHKRKRLLYAVTPRFAITSTADGLRAAAELRRDFPDTLMHTHLAENREEIRSTLQLFPEARSYLDIYDSFGLLGAQSIFAHSIYLDAQDYLRLRECASSIAHCPSSNLFLGSGFFDFAKTSNEHITIGLGSDVGGGTSISMLKTMAEAYKVSTFCSHKLTPLTAFYTATLGGAKALGLDRWIGNFLPGKEADFIVLNTHATALQTLRIAEHLPLEEQLFALMILGDDRSVVATYVNGKMQFKQL